MLSFFPMLNCYIIHSPDQKEKLFSDYLSHETFWMVNDLESKFWVQKYLRKNLSPLIHGDNVKRASEVWESLLLRLDPAWQPISSQMAELLIEKWVVEILRSKPLNISVKDSSMAYQTIGQILPLLSHFQGEDVISEWFSEQEEAKERWADWYELGRILWSQFLERRLIPQEWMKGALVNEELPHLGDKTIVVDLGLDIDDVESELLLNLSRTHDIVVIVPYPEKDKDAYLNLINRSQSEALDKVDKSPARSFRKLPSMLAEVKDAVGWIRKWLDEGIELEQVAVISPQIENYWPTLQEHFRVEGVPVQKPTVTPLSQLPVYQDLMARIRLASKKILTGDSETLCFKATDEPKLDYRTFQGLFTNVYKIDDFHKNEDVQKSLPMAVDPQTIYTMEEFLELLSGWLPQKSMEAFENIIQDLDELFIVSEKLSVEKWVQFLEKHFSRTEKKIAAMEEKGILVLPLKASQNPKIKKAVVVGLAESQLLENKNTALTWTDIESIKLNFGFNLPHADRHVLEDHLFWVGQKDMEEVVFTHGETDFSGRYQSPSMFWLKGAIGHGHDLDLNSPNITRWDEVGLTDPKQEAALSSEQTKIIEELIQRDLGNSDHSQVPYKSLSLSASSFEEFFKCPFKLFARKGLGLGNPPILDLDIDYMTRGRLMHRVCELILGKEGLDLSDEQIKILIDQARIDIEMEVYTDEIWSFLKPYYFQSTKSFLQFEKQWRETYPNTHTFGVEKKIKTFLQVKEGDLSFDDKEGVPFRGVIDRLDRSESGQVAIIDYKSSSSGLTQYTSWLKNGKIQLALYSLALIEGVLENKKMDVVGAFYYVLKNIDRGKGFALSESDGDFLPSKKMVRDDLQNLLDETRRLVAKMMEDILAGNIVPEPNQSDYRICENCDWKKICRNPQLNL